MTLKDMADLATALALIIATATFVLAVLERKQREREKRIQHWQRVVVYKIIEDGGPDGPADFDWIKIQYVTEAIQVADSFKLPTKEIQDSALKLALMSLISDHLISKTNDGQYAINVVSLEENEWRAVAMTQMQKKMAENKLVSKLYETLDRDSGKFTTDQLFREFEAERFGYKFEDFDVLVRDQIARGGIVVEPRTQRLWLRAKVPANTATSNRPPRPE